MKTPHERLLELGFDYKEVANVKNYVRGGSAWYVITFTKYGCSINHTDWAAPIINLEIAQIIVDYLKELENE